MARRAIAPFGLLPEALWRECALWAWECEDSEVSRALLSLTLGLGRDADRTAIIIIARGVRENRRDRRAYMRGEKDPRAIAEDRAELARHDRLLVGLRAATKRPTAPVGA